MAGRGSRVVFGRNALLVTKEQLIHVFKEVGPVESFRLVFDKETGKPKGYGFANFKLQAHYAETASSAVRNLNGYELGGRQLRVDYADMDPAIEAQRQRERGHDNRRGPNQPPRSAAPPMQAPNVPNVPSMASVPDTRSATDQISGTLASMNPQQLYTLMTQMKQLATDRPDYTRQFLQTNPQITYALFQAMIMMNIVDPNIITRILANAPMATTAPPPPMPHNVPPPKMTNAGQPQHFRSPNPQIPYQQPDSMMNVMPGMPPQPPAQMPAAATNDLQQQQKALLMQVLQLSDAEISALPPGQQEQVRQLKQQILMSQT
ncbi:unnamed protein product [Umbelopsis vinacea]